MKVIYIFKKSDLNILGLIVSLKIVSNLWKFLLKIIKKI